MAFRPVCLLASVLQALACSFGWAAVIVLAGRALRATWIKNAFAVHQAVQHLTAAAQAAVTAILNSGPRITSLRFLSTRQAPRGHWSK